jgi:hypothetical protein
MPVRGVLSNISTVVQLVDNPLGRQKTSRVTRGSSGWRPLRGTLAPIAHGENARRAIVAEIWGVKLRRLGTWHLRGRNAESTVFTSPEGESLRGAWKTVRGRSRGNMGTIVA